MIALPYIVRQIMTFRRPKTKSLGANFTAFWIDFGLKANMVQISKT